MRRNSSGNRVLRCTALLLTAGACSAVTEPDATLDAVLARGAANVFGPIDVRDTTLIAGKVTILLPRPDAPRYACGIQLVVGPTTMIFRRSGARATMSELQVGVAIRAWVDDGFTLPFCRPTGGASAIVIEQ
jgi:hypothetical protein